MIGLQNICFWVMFIVHFVLCSIENGSVKFD